MLMLTLSFLVTGDALLWETPNVRHGNLFQKQALQADQVPEEKQDGICAVCEGFSTLCISSAKIHTSDQFFS